MAAAYYGQHFTLPMRAATDMSSHQGRFVTVNSGVSDEIIISSVAAEVAVGVLKNTPNSGFNATVAFTGVVKFKAGAAVNARDLIITNATGFGIAATGSGALGQALINVTSGAMGTMLLYSGPMVAQA